MSKPVVGKIGWIDLTVEDASTVKDFYQSVVGWTSQSVSMGNYDDYSMIPLEGGSEGVAGICHKRGSNAALPSQWLMYVNVADLDESIRRCNEMGGKTVGDIRDMGSYGRFQVIQDPAGAVMALMEPPKG